MYIEGESIYCKSLIGKCLEVLFGILLLIVFQPFMILHVLGHYSKLLLNRVERFDDYISKKLAEFFG